MNYKTCFRIARVYSGTNHDDTVQYNPTQSTGQHNANNFSQFKYTYSLQGRVIIFSVQD